MTSHIALEGDKSEVNGVVCMKIEKNHQKVLFQTVKDKIINYVISNYKNGKHMKPIFKKLENSINTMTIKHKPRPQIKQFVSREYMLRSNMEKLYSILWGQCSSALQVIIKGINENEDKVDDSDVIWLLTEIKKAIYGIDLKANLRLTLHEAVYTL